MIVNENYIEYMAHHASNDSLRITEKASGVRPSVGTDTTVTTASRQLFLALRYAPRRPYISIYPVTHLDSMYIAHPAHPVAELSKRRLLSYPPPPSPIS